MLRLSPPDKEKISQGQVFEKNAGGSELNAASGAAFLGARTAIITKLPDNKIGRFVKYKIRYGNVSDDYVVYDYSPEQRLGIYYYESGAYPRKSSVVYDRANSSMCSISLSEIDPSIYKNTRHFHVSGISMAISKNLRTTVVELIKRFKEQGAFCFFSTVTTELSFGQKKKQEKLFTLYFLMLIYYLFQKKLQEK